MKGVTSYCGLIFCQSLAEKNWKKAPITTFVVPYILLLFSNLNTNFNSFTGLHLNPLTKGYIKSYGSYTFYNSFILLIKSASIYQVLFLDAE